MAQKVSASAVAALEKFLSSSAAAQPKANEATFALLNFISVLADKQAGAYSSVQAYHGAVKNAAIVAIQAAASCSIRASQSISLAPVLASVEISDLAVYALLITDAAQTALSLSDEAFDAVLTGDI